MIDLYGEEGFRHLRAAAVTVLGLGGVGSHAAIALARSGVGRLHLIDHDRLTASSLNRFPCAAPGDVGRFKVEFLGEHLARTCPDTTTTTAVAFFDAGQAGVLLLPRPDIVADAIDSLGPKVALLEHCLRTGLPVVSSMGAAARRDPAQIRVGNLFETRGCPLAKHVRRWLRRRGLSEPIACVYSVEQAGAVLPPDPQDGQPVRGRIRQRLPSQATLPGIFGYALANTVIEILVAGGPHRRGPHRPAQQ